MLVTLDLTTSARRRPDLSQRNGYPVTLLVCAMKLMKLSQSREPVARSSNSGVPERRTNPFVKALAADVRSQSPTPNDIGDY